MANELDLLKARLKLTAESKEDFEQLSEVAGATEAAKGKNGNEVLKHLANIGKWTFDTAKDIGVGVVVELINKHMGGPSA